MVAVGEGRALGRRQVGVVEHADLGGDGRPVVTAIGTKFIEGNDIRKIFGFFDTPPLTVTKQLILFLLSAFWGPPSPHPLRTSYMEAT